MDSPAGRRYSPGVGFPTGVHTGPVTGPYRWSGPEVGNGGRSSGGGAWARPVFSPEERR